MVSVPIVERILHWLGVATTAEVIHRINRVVLDCRQLVDRIKMLEEGAASRNRLIHHLMERIEALEAKAHEHNKKEPYPWRLANPPATPAGEPKTENGTTSTCGNTGDESA